MTIKLSTKGGGGGPFEASSLSGGINIAAGSSGTLATITPTSGKRAALTLIHAFTNANPNMTITIGAKTLTDDLTLTTASQGLLPVGAFIIGANFASTTTNITEAIGAVDEVITITLTSGVTVGIIEYAFAEGD